jgi:hypothetical protein
VSPATGSLHAAPPFPPAGSRRARFPRSRQYYEGATTSHPRICGHLWIRFRSPPDPSCFVFATALLQGRRFLPSPGLGVPAARLSGFFVWTRMGSLRSPGDPSRASAALLDPGRTDVSWPLRPRRCCPRFAHNEGFGNCISGLTHAALAPAVLRFALRVATHAQGSLPAGWLAFAGRASNPLDRYERFQLVFTIIPLPCSPDASAIALLRLLEDKGRCVSAGREK